MSRNSSISLASDGFERIGAPRVVSAPTGLFNLDDDTDKRAPRLHDNRVKPKAYFLRNLSCPMVKVISRGFGVTKLASAKIAPYTIPQITASTVRKRNRLGMAAPQAGY